MFAAVTVVFPPFTCCVWVCQLVTTQVTFAREGIRMGDMRFECAEDDMLTAQMNRLSHVIFFSPSSLVNSSIRIHTIYKRNLEDIRGCKTVTQASLEFDAFNSLCFSVFFLFFSLPYPQEWFHSVADVGGRISLRN